MTQGSRDPAADQAAPLIDEVYHELRRLAEGYVRRERNQSIQATELVHEAYLRLAREPSPRWHNRTHFVAIAAISMRRLLVERARARGAAKRGGGVQPVPLDTAMLDGRAGPQLAADPAAPDQLDLVALDDALTALAALDPQQARLVELRFFGGLTVEEAAEAIGISPATVKRHWAVARAFLLREIQRATRP